MKKLIMLLLLPVLLFAQPTPKENLQRAIGTNVVTGTNLGAPFQVATIAALKAVTVANVANGLQVRLVSYATIGDGGGGTFYYSSSSSATDNGGTVIAPNIGSGRWLRVIDNNTITANQFGATGDGVTSDTAALTNAISALSEGQSLFLPAGTYYTGPLTLTTSGTTIIGQGRGVTILKMVDSSSAAWVLKLGGQISNCKVANLTLDGNRANGGTSGSPGVASGSLFIDASNVTVTQVEAKNNKGVGAIIYSTVTEPSDIIFEDCYFRDNGPLVDSGSGNGIGLGIGGGSIKYPNNITVNNCYFLENHGVGHGYDSSAINSSGTNVIITNSRFKNNYNGAGGQVYQTNRSAGSTNLIVDTCSFELTSRLDAGDATSGVEFGGSGCSVLNSTFTNVAGATGGVQSAVFINDGGSSNILVGHNNVKDYDYGLNLSGTTASDDVSVSGNIFNNTNGAVRWGVNVSPYYTHVLIEGNNFTGCLQDIPGTPSSTTVVRSNMMTSYPAPSSITVGASPFSYTSGSTAEMIAVEYGTVSDISVGGLQLFASTHATILLQPNTTIVISYTVTPQVQKYKQW